MRYLKFLTILSVAFLTVACNQEPAGNKATAPSVLNQTLKTPLEEQITKVTNTVLLEPLQSLRDDSSFYNEKQYLAYALDNSTQKDIFFSCDEFKKSLLQLLQTDYSLDFVTDSWQRGEVEKLAQDLAKEQCGSIYTLRADFLADLQYSLNSVETKDAFLEKVKPIVENYANDLLTSNSHYTALFNKILVPYKKLRQTFYPLEKAGYNTHFLEQNAFKSLRNLINPIFQNKDIDDNKIEQLLNNAQKDEKILFVFLKKYDSLTQTNGECIDNFFQGLKDKWYDFMYEIEKLPADERQAYADKRFNQANDGLKTKCADLLKNSKKQNTAQNTPEQKQQETYQEEEVYDF